MASDQLTRRDVGKKRARLLCRLPFLESRFKVKNIVGGDYLKPRLR